MTMVKFSVILASFCLATAYDLSFLANVRGGRGDVENGAWADSSSSSRSLTDQ